MPKYFLTKVWGFSPDDYPVLGFPEGGGLRKFLKESDPDDWVVVAGTKGPETSPEERGRLLGMMKLGRNTVDVVDVLTSLGTPIPAEHRRDDGSYRWPLGLPMVHARRFVDIPDLDSVFGKYHWRQEWAAFALELSAKFPAEVIERLATLPTERVDITASPIIAAQAAVHETLGLNRVGPTGPGPSDHRDAIDRNPGWGCAYLLRLRGPGGWTPTLPILKVGRAVDVEARVRTLNRALLGSVTGYKWEVVMEQRFSDEPRAHAFEQALHERMFARRVKGQTEVYSVAQGDLESEWAAVLSAGKWAIVDKG